jgi:hypothetical protein
MGIGPTFRHTEITSDGNTTPQGDELPGGQRATGRGSLNPWKIAAGSSVVPLLVIGLVNLLQGADQQALYVLLPQMRGTLGYDLGFVLLFGTAVSIINQGAAPLVGFVADRVKRCRSASPRHPSACSPCVA